ncbi:hypothetical protein CEXT_794021 [Caerostris extrusa]|uniref:Uncharacterized protein n=1 Tax=Caerostris extrusa TaxID=172846 RepID=A0AAV4VGM6_CAEEX|nr:hypothetical protein CEXT_794021 [Caerostris extrusa]
MRAFPAASTLPSTSTSILKVYSRPLNFTCRPRMSVYVPKNSQLRTPDQSGRPLISSAQQKVADLSLFTNATGCTAHSFLFPFLPKHRQKKHMYKGTLKFLNFLIIPFELPSYSIFIDLERWLSLYF